LEKNLLGAISVALVLLGYASYFRSIFLRCTKPHMFSWIVWGLSDLVAFSGQLVSGSGAGSWSTATTCVLCLTIAGLSFSHGEKNITKGDWIAFIVALSAIPLWYFTKDPTGSIALAAFVDITGIYPTVRKSYGDPYGENLFAWTLHAARSVIVILAIEHYSVATIIYPFAILVSTGGLSIMLAWRRYAMGKTARF
jgi:hypothetical protein